MLPPNRSVTSAGSRSDEAMVRYAVFSGAEEARRAAEWAPDLGAHWVRLGDQTVVRTAQGEWEAFAERARRAGIGTDRKVHMQGANSTWSSRLGAPSSTPIQRPG